MAEDEDDDSDLPPIFIFIATLIAAVLYLILFMEILAILITFIVVSFLILKDFVGIYISWLKQKLPHSYEKRKIDGDQPAYKTYFFRDAFIDLKDIISETWNVCKKYSKLTINRIKSIIIGIIKCLSADVNAEPFWIRLPLRALKTLISIVLGTPIVLSMVLAIIFSGTFCLIVILIHYSIVFISISVIVIIVKIFNWLELLNMIKSHIFMVCPSCYKKFSLPIYLCSECNVEHTKLVPGEYGIFKRKCECRHSIPTLLLNGKNKLPSKCPICDYPLISDIGVTINAHYSIIGGESSGKSSFLKASMIVLSELSGDHFEISFPYEKDNITFEIDKRNFEKGELPSKITVEEEQRAFLAKIQHNKKGFFLKRKVSHLIYIYKDRELTNGNNDSKTSNEYYEYINGIFFIVDPFSIHTIKTEYSQKITNFFENATPSQNSPKDVFNYMMQNLEEKAQKKNSFSKNRKYKIPIAVIITKSDLLGLDIDNSSESVRNWLYKQTQQDNLVPNLESKFTDVRYFSCSSLGHIPSEASKFTPKDIKEIWDWMLSFKEVLN